MNFVQSTAFGRVGAAALRPVYARAHANIGSDSLNTGLEAALRALLLMLGGLKPRFVPFSAQGVTAQVYSNAYFQLGDRHWKPGDPDLTLQWKASHSLDSPNGWGFIVRVGARITYGHGAVSRQLLQRFTSRRALIYFLEIYAQLIAFFTHLDVLPQYWISFIDNSSGLAALQKGYGRDPAVNLLLTLFWSVACEQSWVPEFQWVPSDLNLADPVSRGDLTVAEPSWSRLESGTDGFERALFDLSADNMAEITQRLRRLKWRWS